MEPLPESGPAELASLARNFNTMAREISVLLANRTTLLAGISHDLRTPLTRMRLALALLPEDVDASLIERFERNLQGMDELIADALTFARGTSESAHEVELKSFVAEIVRSFEGAEFHTHPDVSDDYSLELAPSAFQRVLLNLIGNASNYGQRVVVKLRTNRVVVEDDGPGVPVEHRTQIFQPFFRLDESRNTHTGGSGLGLAIVAQLCQAHGWQVEVSDAKIGGARFTLRF